jgi:hypothetical protein
MTKRNGFLIGSLVFGFIICLGAIAGAAICFWQAPRQAVCRDLSNVTDRGTCDSYKFGGINCHCTEGCACKLAFECTCHPTPTANKASPTLIGIGVALIIAGISGATACAYLFVIELKK